MRNRHITEKCPYVYVGGIYLKRYRDQEYENVSILIVVGVSGHGYRNILGTSESLKNALKAGRISLFGLNHEALKVYKAHHRGQAPGTLKAIARVFPEAAYQRCIVYFYRNIMSVVTRQKIMEVMRILKAIHAYEYRRVTLESPGLWWKTPNSEAFQNF